MTLFLCKLWPYLAGGLIGWLLAGWFARRLKHTKPPVEKIVEKHIDNPQHLSLISKLQTENKQIADLKSQLEEAKSSSGSSGAAFVAAAGVTAVTGSVSGKSASVETKVVEKIVEKEVIKTVDNPEHLKRISDLENQLKNLQHGQNIDIAAAKAAGLSLKGEGDFTVIEGIGPKISELIQGDGVKTFNQLSNTPVSSIQSVLDNAGSRYKLANPGTWPDQANLAANNRWGALKALQDVLDGGVYPNDSVTKASSSNINKSKDDKKVKTAASTTSNKADDVSNVDVAAAKAAGFRVKIKNGQDDFTVIEGIGPKINELIHAEEIHTYSQLGKTFVEDIQKILDKAGPRYTLAKPGTWPAQADMASSNKWESLKAWQEKLDGGKE